MNGYTRFPLKTKLEMMKMYTEKSISISVIAAKFNVRKDTLKHWIRKYKAKGIDALKPNQANKRKFSIDFKKEVVKLVINGKSIKSTAILHNLDPSVVRAWIKWYNLTNQDNKNEEVSDMMYKKFSPNQKIKVVKFCINNNNDFNLTSKEFGIPYSTVYNWVKLYQTNGRNCFNTKKNKLTKDDKKIFDAAARAEIMEVYEAFLKKKPKIERLMKLYGEEKLKQLILEKKIKI